MNKKQAYARNPKKPKIGKDWSLKARKVKSV